MATKKKVNYSPEQRRIQTQKVILSVLSIILILSMILSMLIK